MTNRIAVCIAVYNEESNIGNLFQAIVSQTQPPHELVIVDDGSNDSTPLILKNLKENYTGAVNIQLILQSNGGPAAARNSAWRRSSSDICVFTDGDCKPRHDWLEKLVAPLENNLELSGTAGAYSKPDSSNILSQFIGLEILWRYSRMSQYIDCHGTYNLAIRKSLLEQVGGFNEKYKKPSGEDFDLTYKISKLGKLLFVSEAQVQHDHPNQFWAYMKNQFQRGIDRVRLYFDNPAKIKNDSYTEWQVKYEVLFACLAIALLPLAFLSPAFRGAWLLVMSLLLVISLRTLPYLIQEKGLKVAVYGFGVHFCRVFAWALGLQYGLMNKLRER